MNGTVKLVLIGAVALAVAAPGCGSDDGEKVFASAGCANCHTLAAAGATGQVGANLDVLKPTATHIVAIVTQGGGGMPSFAGQLSSGEIKAVADYVEKATR